MEYTIMTRKTSMKDMEAKFQLTLKELQSSKELNRQLLQEREDSEEEIQKIVNKNTELKSELAKLNEHCLDVVSQRDNLLEIVTSFKECSEEHERALSRITELEVSLYNAQKAELELEKIQTSQKCDATESLYNELVIPAPDSNTTLQESKIKHTPMSSHNKIKKYIKLNKFIRKTKKNINNYQYICKMRKDRSHLINKVKSSNNKLQNNKIIYENDIEQLQLEISSLQRSLDFVNKKYELAQKQIEEYMYTQSQQSS